MTSKDDGTNELELDIEALSSEESELVILSGDQLLDARNALVKKFKELKATPNISNLKKAKIIRDHISMIDAKLAELNALTEETADVDLVSAGEQAETVDAPSASEASPETKSDSADTAVGDSVQEGAVDAENADAVKQLVLQAAATSKFSTDKPDESESPLFRLIPGNAYSSAVTASADAAPDVSLRVAEAWHQEAAKGGPVIENVLVAAVSQYAEDTPSVSPVASADTNTSVIEAALRSASARRRELGPQVYDGKSLTAAACEPFEVLRTIPSCFSAERPFTSAIANIPGDRGSIRWTRPLALSDVQAGAPLWTDAQQAAVDPNDSSTWKPCVTIPCGTTDAVTVQMFPVCVTLDYSLTFSTPERRVNTLETIAAARSRAVETAALSVFDANAHRLTLNASNCCDFEGLIVREAGVYAGYVRAHTRSTDLSGLSVIVDVGALQVAAGGDYMRCCDMRDSLREKLGKLGFNIVEVVDPGTAWAGFASALPTPGGPPVARPAIPNTFTVRFADLGQWFAITAPAIPIETTRDLNQFRQNRITYFGEEFVGWGKTRCTPEVSLQITFGTGCCDPVTTGP